MATISYGCYQGPFGGHTAGHIRKGRLNVALADGKSRFPRRTSIAARFDPEDAPPEGPIRVELTIPDEAIAEYYGPVTSCLGSLAHEAHELAGKGKADR